MIVHQNAEALVVRALTKALPVEVAVDVPNPRPTSWVRISRTGGAQDLVRDEVQLVVEAWASSTLAAGDLLRQVQSHLVRLPLTEPLIARAETTGFVNLPDPYTNNARYQLLLSLVTIATVTSS